MPRQSRTMAQALESQCAISRCLGVLSDSWSFLLLRESFLGARTFAQFRDALGIASDVLSARLAVLVERGVLKKTPYQEPGQRTRDAYDLTPAGEELKVVLVAMQQWGEVNVPRRQGSRVLPLTIDGQEQVKATLVNASGRIVSHANVEFARVASSSAALLGGASMEEKRD